MSNSTLADNWSLQDIASFFNNGMSEEPVITVNIKKEEDSFDYGEIPGSIIQMETLFEFLNDLILRDQVIVDEEFIESWSGKSTWLDSMYKENIVRSFPFRREYEKILEVRPTFEEKLCVTTDLLNAHNENIQGWRENGVAPNAYLSQVIWGGAGMIARGFVYEHSYTPHPLRRRFFTDSCVYQDKPSALNRLGSFVESKRAAIKYSKYGDNSVNTFSLSIQPVVARIIRESSSASDLMSVAVSLREEYAELRDWIRQYQEAMNQPDMINIAKSEDLINSVSKYIDSKKELSNDDAATFTAGFSVLKMAIKGNPVNYVKNQFGVRSSICELIMTESWESDLRKFLGFFGHRSSKLGLKVIEYYGGSGT